MPKIRFILNPISGGANAGRQRQARVSAFIQRHQLDAEIALTQYPKHATTLAQAAVADGYELVVAVGGDGTLNEVARALVNQPVDFGLVPSGSGNGFARHLGLPLDFDQALAVLLRGQIQRVDSALAGGIPFFNVFGAGLDAEIAQRFNQSPQRGPLPYFWLGWQTWRNYQPRVYELELDGQAVYSSEAALICVANISQYGNNAQIAPGADITDGQLDVVAIRQPNFGASIQLARRLFAGSLLQHPLVWHRRASTVRISLPKGAAAHTDGELHDFGQTVEINCLPQSLRVRV